MKKDKKCYFYVYVTRHGVSSEISCLHVGYQQVKPTIYSYIDWFSNGVDKDIADKVYEKVKRYNNYDWHEEINARKDIEYWIDHFENG